jgi:hypothetical protein
MCEANLMLYVVRVPFFQLEIHKNIIMLHIDMAGELRNRRENKTCNINTTV